MYRFKYLLWLVKQKVILTLTLVNKKQDIRLVFFLILIKNTYVFKL